MKTKQRRVKWARVGVVTLLTVLFVTVGLVFAYVGEPSLSVDNVSTVRSLDTSEHDSPDRYRQYLDAAESASIEYDSQLRYQQYLDAIDQAQLAQGGSLTAEFASIKNDSLRYQQYLDAIEQAQLAQDMFLVEFASIQNDSLRYQQYLDAIERTQQAQSESLAAELLGVENDSAIRFQQYLDATE